MLRVREYALLLFGLWVTASDTMPPTDAVLHMKFSHATAVCAKGEKK